MNWTGSVFQDNWQPAITLGCKTNHEEKCFKLLWHFKSHSSRIKWFEYDYDCNRGQRVKLKLSANFGETNQDGTFVSGK